MAFGHSDIQNRFGYHRANADSAPKHAEVRRTVEWLAKYWDDLLPDGRDKSLAFTALQEAMHWANSAIAMQNDVDTETPHLPNAPTN